MARRRTPPLLAHRRRRPRQAAGRADAALRRYQECAEILRREFGREPSAETEKVREAIAAALEKSPAPRNVFLKPLDRPVLILLVEDDLVSQALMEGFLTDAG